ncbi:hypothetical protein WJX72_007372 [[Myrmecia] bisecta]|uniref:Uncharacterized protein n=1 Tax=[Myrmecia] bisecta TaxID=41462 RepID=A0AAW1PGH1_9CHLO
MRLVLQASGSLRAAMWRPLQPPAVHDLLMIDDKPLCELSEEDVNDEPVVILGCGHVFTRTSMDGWLELVAREEVEEDGASSCYGAYEQDPSSGTWLRPAPLQGRAAPAKSCPQCKAPICNIFRYGRSLNKRMIDAAEIKHSLEANRLLMAADRKLALARADAGTRLVSCPDLQKAWDEVRGMVPQAQGAFLGYGKAVKLCQRMPTMAVYEATKGRNADMGAAPAQLHAVWAEVINVYKQAADLLEHAVKLASDHRATRTQVLALLALVRLRQQQIQDLGHRKSANMLHNMGQAQELMSNFATLEDNLDSEVRDGLRACAMQVKAPM